MRKLRRRRKPQGYTAENVARMFGVDYHTFMGWISRKLVRASVRNAGKQWVPVIFARDDLLEVLLVFRLRQVDLGTRLIKKAVGALRKMRERATGYILISAEGVRVARLASTTEQALTIAINLDKLHAELGKKLGELEAAKEAAVRAEHRHEHSSIA